MKAGAALGHLALLMGSWLLHALIAKLTFWPGAFPTPVTRCISMDALLLPATARTMLRPRYTVKPAPSATALSPAWGTLPSIPKLPEQMLVPSAGIEGSHWNGSGSLGRRAALVRLNMLNVGGTTTDT